MTDRRAAATSSEDWGWQAARDAQRRRLARLSLREKLSWLEEAQRLVDHLRSQLSGSDPQVPGPREPGS